PNGSGRWSPPRRRDICIIVSDTGVVTCRRSSVVVSPPLSNSAFQAFQQASRGGGGDRWVAHTGVAGHRRLGHLRRSSAIGRPGRCRAVVMTLTRGAPGRGAG